MRVTRITLAALLVALTVALPLLATGCRAQPPEPPVHQSTAPDLLTQGRAQFHAGQYEAAEGTFEKALKERPDLEAARYFEGRCAYQRGDYADAAGAFAEIVAKSPNSAESWARLGQTYEALKRPQDALTAYKTARRLDPQSELAREGLARLGPKKRIAITFDGDPVPAFVTRAMDEAEKYGGKITFFLVSENLAHKPQVVPAIEKRGHEIGNHSYNHPHLDRCSEEQIRYQLGHTNDIIAAQGGTKPTFMRPPFGDHNARSDRITRELGMKVVLWDVDPTDWREGKPGVTVADYVLSHAKPDAVVLLHQGDNTYGVLDRIFAGLNAQGFTCVRLDELPRYPQDVGVYPR